jgi:hypothetical protein
LVTATLTLSPLPNDTCRSTLRPSAPASLSRTRTRTRSEVRGTGCRGHPCMRQRNHSRLRLEPELSKVVERVPKSVSEVGQVPAPSEATEWRSGAARSKLCVRTAPLTGRCSSRLEHPDSSIWSRIGSRRWGSRTPVHRSSPWRLAIVSGRGGRGILLAEHGESLPLVSVCLTSLHVFVAGYCKQLPDLPDMRGGEVESK